MASTEKRERREIKDVLRADAFLETTEGLLSEFVPTYEDDRETIIQSVVFAHKKGDITITVSGTRDEHGLLEEGRLHFVRNGKQTAIEVKSVGLSYPDMKRALKVMRVIAGLYGRSNLPRRTA